MDNFKLAAKVKAELIRLGVYIDQNDMGVDFDYSSSASDKTVDVYWDNGTSTYNTYHLLQILRYCKSANVSNIKNIINRNYQTKFNPLSSGKVYAAIRDHVAPCHPGLQYKVESSGTLIFVKFKTPMIVPECVMNQIFPFATKHSEVGTDSDGFVVQSFIGSDFTPTDFRY